MRVDLAGQKSLQSILLSTPTSSDLVLAALPPSSAPAIPPLLAPLFEKARIMGLAGNVVTSIFRVDSLLDVLNKEYKHNCWIEHIRYV